MSKDYWAKHPYRDCAHDHMGRSWYCTRVVGHDGPCAAHPRGLNRVRQWIRLRSSR